jgi:serine/threonine protein kinase
MTLEEYSSALRLIPDEELYPKVPEDIQLTLVPENLDNDSAYVKRPGLTNYESMKGTDFVPKALLDETLIMEQISKSPHPNIIGYHGCRVRRGRITAILLEQLEETLTQRASTPSIQELDQDGFLKALESAVDHIHSLGLAHNDINPDNIMFKNGAPVLIDFGSCQPFGKRLQSLGTPGWYEELFFTSEKKHDIYSLTKMREWLRSKIGKEGSDTARSPSALVPDLVSVPGST